MTFPSNLLIYVFSSFSSSNYSLHNSLILSRFLNATLCSHSICLVWVKCLIALCPSFAVLNIFLTSSGVSTSPNSSFIACALAVTPDFFAALFACLYIYRSYCHPVFPSSSLPLSYTFPATLHLIIHPRLFFPLVGLRHLTRLTPLSLSHYHPTLLLPPHSHSLHWSHVVQNIIFSLNSVLVFSSFNLNHLILAVAESGFSSYHLWSSSSSQTLHVSPPQFPQLATHSRN